MRKALLGLAAMLFTLSPYSVEAASLTVGDPAPPLTVSKWVKGEKVDKFEQGQIYVVEFWATWCGPCRVTIPHLTELQKKNKGVTFIGVSVFESEPKDVEPFVKEMGDKMDYRVAMDDVPKNGMPDEGKMAKAWMEAAEENGIPTAFIIAKNGKIAWIGHPGGMDEPLNKIVTGEYDIAAAASKRNEVKAAEKAMKELSQKLSGLLGNREKNRKQILEVIDMAIAENVAIEANLSFIKFEILMSGDDPKAASDYGNKLVDSTLKDESNALNNLAWSIINPESKLAASKRDNKLALRAAQRAYDLTKGEESPILDTYALALFENGNPAKALEIQEKAVKLAPEKDPGMMERLEKYRKAAEKK